MPASASEVEKLKHAPPHPRILAVIRQRWSPRAFADREVSAEDLKTVFEAARWAASSFNEQPWRFFVGRRGSETYNKIFQSLGEFNQAWARLAPVLILGVAKTTFAHNNAPNRVALYDLGAAAATLCYQATALGLHTHQMAGFDPEAARRLFQVPEDFLFGAVIALGYQGEPSALTVESQRQQETAPRSRKAVSDFVLAELGQPASFD